VLPVGLVVLGGRFPRGLRFGHLPLDVRAHGVQYRPVLRAGPGQLQEFTELRPGQLRQVVLQDSRPEGTGTDEVGITHRCHPQTR
jgi:hypothetical protein